MENTTKAIKQKLRKLNEWLVNNPSHPDSFIVLKDAQNLKQSLIKNTRTQ